MHRQFTARSRATALASLALTVGLAAGCGAGESTDSGRNGSDPIRIGLITDLSGRLVTFGRDIQSATTLAVDKVNATGGINGAQLELEIKDTGGEPSRAVTAVRDLASDDVVAISGPLSSGEAEVVFAQVGRVEVPTVSGTANKDGIAPLGEGWAFVNQATNTALYDAALPAWTRANTISTAALVYDEAESVSAAAATGTIPSAATKVGLNIVNADSPITFSRGQTDFATTVQRIRATDADGLIIMSAPSEAGLIARELARQGEVRPVLGHPSQGTQSFYQAGGTSIKNWMLPLIFDPGSAEPDSQQFVQDMNKVITEPPLVAESANYYDNILMFAEVLRAAGINGGSSTDDARRAVRDGLLALTGFDGVTGTISFGGNPEAKKTVHLVVVRDGVPTPL